MPEAKSSRSGGGGRRRRASAGQGRAQPAAGRGSADGDPSAGLAEQLINRVLQPFDAIMLTRERIEQTLDEAAERGRITRSDANDLVTELVSRGRQQTNDLLGEIEVLLGRGRDQLGSATRRARRSEPVDRIVRTADRARRSVGGSSFPIAGYEDMTAGQVTERLDGLKPPELRRVRDYERRHANRKTVLQAIERALS